MTATGPEGHDAPPEATPALHVVLHQPEIAAKLFIAPKTVGKHIEHILAKLGVHSRAQAVAVAVRDELIETHRRAPDVEAHRSFAT